MSSLDYLDLCRLCLVKERVSVPIFEGEGDVRQIFLKIAACLPVKVAREDKLPKKICDDCVYKVELFYQFWNTTANAEKQLLQWLGEVSLEDKQGYVTNVLNPNMMKQEQSNENRLDGGVMQQVSGHQNSMSMGLMDNIGLGIPMMMSTANQQQITSVPMDTVGSAVQTVQAVPGPSTQAPHERPSQNETGTSARQEEEEETSEEDENSDDECDADEGLPVKEESEEDPNNSRTIEPTTFVNVSLACDEAGPSGLQQQKISEMPEMTIPQSTDGDPKSTGCDARDPLELTYLMVQNYDKFYLVPMGAVYQPPSPGEARTKKERPGEHHRDDGDDADGEADVQLNGDTLSKSIRHGWENNGNGQPGYEPYAASTVRNVYICHWCQKIFKKNYQLQRHVTVHTSERTHECPVCHQCLKTKTTLRFHMQLHEGQVYRCPECPFHARSSTSLRRHHLRMHAQRYAYPYANCASVCQLGAMPSEDARRGDELELTVSCEHCGKFFKNEHALQRHRREHEKYHPVPFGPATATVTSTATATDDPAAIDEKPEIDVKPEIVEDVDDKPLVQRLIADAPPKDSDAAKRGRYLKCPKCRWAFSRPELLVKHFQRHFMSYKCDMCEAVFKYKGSFLKHKAMHPIEVPRSP